MNKRNREQKKPFKTYCDVGQHEVTDEYVSVCAICNRTACHRHQGNPEALPGSYVACPLHAEEVEAMNRAQMEGLRRSVRGETSEKEETEDAGEPGTHCFCCRARRGEHTPFCDPSPLP